MSLCPRCDRVVASTGDICDLCIRKELRLVKSQLREALSLLKRWVADCENPNFTPPDLREETEELLKGAK